MRLLTTTLLALTYFFAPAQQYLTQSLAPKWVTDYDHDNALTDSSDFSGGYAYLLVSLQNHLETKEFYRKEAIMVVSEQGLSRTSSISVSFDPSYQRVLFHTLLIVRNGRVIDKLDTRKFELLRREEEMDRAVYDKTLDAVYNIPGLRVGDIVEYSYTVKGSNPAFDGHAFGTLYMEYSVPVKKFALRVLHNVNRQLQHKTYGDAFPPRETTENAVKSLEWVRENVPALLTDDMLPSWYDPYDHIQYTDFESWKEVRSWALKLYADAGGSGDGILAEVVRQIKALPASEEEKIKWCIRIVQAEIRYLSFSDGVNGYKPHPPGMVFDQKYGDCKDKSLLLSYLLNGIGIESFPALVSTVKGPAMSELLPDPWAFNHCIVQFSFNDSTYWIDPTLPPQTGPLNRYYFPTYDHALVIREADSELEPVPFGYKESLIEVLEEYLVEAVDGDVTLNVVSRYLGDEADRMRAYRKNNSREEIHKNYLNFYARDYAEISLKKDVVFNDDTIQNILTSTETYLLKDFWFRDSLSNKTTGSVYARILASYVEKPNTELRTMPLSLTHPRHVRQMIKVYLPEPWNVEKETIDIESGGFVFHSGVAYQDRVLTLEYSYKSKAAFVDAAAVSDHIRKVNKVLGDLNYSVYKYDQSEDQGSSAATYLILAMLLGTGVYFVRKKMKPA